MPERPTGIAVLAISAGINGLCGLLLAGASQFGIAFAVLHFIIAYGLWVGARWAWALTFVLDVVFFAWSIFMLSNPWPPSFYMLPMVIVYPLSAFLLFSGILRSAVLIIGMIIEVLIIWYLMRTPVRSFFTKIPSTTVSKD
jgi:hypothetical protein